jgi:hypothetical protein
VLYLVIVAPFFTACLQRLCQVRAFPTAALCVLQALPVDLGFILTWRHWMPSLLVMVSAPVPSSSNKVIRNQLKWNAFIMVERQINMVRAQKVISIDGPHILICVCSLVFFILFSSRLHDDDAELSISHSVLAAYSFNQSSNSKAEALIAGCCLLRLQ